MTETLKITRGMRLEWRMERMLGNGLRYSPEFSFKGSKWSIEMRYTSTAYLAFLCKSTPWNDFQPFEVTTWLESERGNDENTKCVRVTVEREMQYVWRAHEEYLLNHVPEFEVEGFFTVVSMFHPEFKSRSRRKWKSRSTQETSDAPPSPDGLSLDSSRPPRREPSADQSVQAALELPAELEDLSLDLGNLLEKAAMPDVDLKCIDGIVRAHRAVLSARSEVFSAMFRNDMAESRTGVVDVPEDTKVLELLLKYVYTGKLTETSVDLIPSLYVASNKYAIHGLKKASSGWMTGNLNEENCLDYLVLADAHCDAPFKDAVVSFILDSKEEVFKSTAWFQFQEQQPKLTIEVFNRCFVK